MEFLFNAILSLSAAYGLVYIGSALFRPGWFLASVTVEKKDPSVIRKKPDWQIFAHVSLVFICLGVVIYGALDPLVSVIPVDWGSRDEDGVWQYTRDAVKIFGAFWGSLFLSSRLDSIAKAQVLRVVNEKGLRAYRKALWHPGTSPSTQNLAIERLKDETDLDNSEFGKVQKRWHNEELQYFTEIVGRASKNDRP